MASGSHPPSPPPDKRSTIFRPAHAHRRDTDLQRGELAEVGDDLLGGDAVVSPVAADELGILVDDAFADGAGDSEVHGLYLPHASLKGYVSILIMKICIYNGGIPKPILVRIRSQHARKKGLKR
jgi:hypothetical protein